MIKCFFTGELHLPGQRLNPVHKHQPAAGAQEGLAVPLQLSDSLQVTRGAVVPGHLQGPHNPGCEGHGG